MSKASLMALAGIRRQGFDLARDCAWKPLGLDAAEIAVLPSGDSAGWSVEISSGSVVKWSDLIEEGCQSIQVFLKPGAQLVWLISRNQRVRSSSREVSVHMGAGSSLVLAEAFELGENESHGESVSIWMEGEKCHAQLVGRWAQQQGSQLVQETLGSIGPMAAGSFFDQSSKALKMGDVKLSLLEPNLKVEVDEAKANHGAAHGGVDEMAMHALMSRGIGRELAGRLVVSSFLGDAWRKAKASHDDLAFLKREESEAWS